MTETQIPTKVAPAENGVNKQVIRDPLEGVIEGNNPLERYQHFTGEVLGKIWPIGAGQYSDDFYRSTIYDERLSGVGKAEGGWQAGYLQFSPAGRDPANLTPKEFDVMVQNINSPDYVRVRSVPPQMLTPDTRPLRVGGSCAIETWGERTMKMIMAGIEKKILDPRLAADTARRLIDLAPTESHATGAILGGHDAAVHLIETDMWIQRLVKDYGLPAEEADTITREAYGRIHDIVARRSKLINLNSVLIPVNFDELGLPIAINKWMSDMGISYDPSYRIAEVIYTYVGPNQLKLVKGALQRQLDADGHSGPVRQAMEALLQSDLHMRLKQIDHLRWGSMDLPKEVIMGMREPTEEEAEKMRTDFAYAMGITIMRDVYIRTQNSTTTSIAAGAADLPTRGNSVSHETRHDFSGEPGTPDETEKFLASVENQFTDPTRLHRHTIDAHLQYLGGYTSDTKTAKMILSNEMAILQENLRPVKKADQEVIRAQEALNKATDDNRDTRESKLSTAQSALKVAHSKSPNFKTDESRAFELKNELNKIVSPSYFPLSDNPFIHHAMQFLWDPDFVLFMRESVHIQEQRSTGAINKEESNEQLRRLMGTIYPKLETYINYLYGRIDYPTGMRNSQLLLN